MEKSQTELLQEFQEEIARLKEQIEALEDKISALLPEPVPTEEEAVDFTDWEIGEADVAAPAATLEPADEPAVEAGAINVPELEIEPIPEPAPEPVQDETAHLPWRTDQPGMPVKNIRSGISLLDRALFIGTLFKEDFSLYDKTIADINAMSSLDQAVDYIREHFPDWNLKSDVVYHFMMSIRKKLS